MTTPDTVGGLPLLQFAVFDEFGKGADDRVWDYGRLCFEAGRELCRAAPAGGDVPSWRNFDSAIDAKALATATEIALMWGNDRSQFVSRIQVAVIDAMRWMGEGDFQRSTHHVHRGPESLPCYCAGTSDHPIGQEIAKDGAPAGGEPVLGGAVAQFRTYCEQQAAPMDLIATLEACRDEGVSVEIDAQRLIDLFTTHSAPAGPGDVSDEEIADLSRLLEEYAIGADTWADTKKLGKAAALLRKLQQGADYVMVPREPTEAMVRASFRIDLSYMPGQESADRAAVYRAMIAASQDQEGGK